MDKTALYFLEAMKAALQDRSVKWSAQEPVEWSELLRLADSHHVLPMVFQAAYRTEAAAAAPAELMATVRKRTRNYVMLQTRKTFEFLPVYAALEQANAPALVVKGAVCRDLYPQSDLRISGDEDLLVRPEQYSACAASLESSGVLPADPRQDPESSHEVTFRQPGGALCIELHKSLFPPESAAYGDLNRFFADAFDRSITVPIQGLNVRTLCPTDHLLYLILHAFKHFLHSGFGLRQVCDIALFANRWGREIDWAWVLESCAAARADRFAGAIFAIGEKYLTFDPDAACCPDALRQLMTGEEPLLLDLLSGGVYGSSSEDRLHSSNMTLHAVAAQKQGNAPSGGVLHSIFPPASSMKRQYRYLERHPWLLPAAWTDRILRYGLRSGSRGAKESVRIGNRRVELLRQYGILDK